MIRVLHVVTAMNRAGLETMIMNYYRHIDKNIIQFDFLTHRPGHFDYSDEIEKLGGKIFHISRLNPFSISYRRELLTFFKEHTEYKIVHVHLNCMSSVILKAAKKCNVPIRIAHSHIASSSKDFKYPIRLFYKQFIPKYATNLFACGKEAGKYIFGGSDYKLIHNAIDVNLYSYSEKWYFDIRQKLGIKQDELAIGHVGRFMTQKNHSFIIDIFNELSKSVKAKLILVGEGELFKKIEEKIKSLGLTEKVILTGIVSNVYDYLQAMDVFVFPSLLEGLPLTVIEAQASGLPCLISDKVPIECKKTDLVEQISLENTAEIWAKKILNYSNHKRKNTSEEIAKSGYDINQEVKWLETFYKNSLK